MATSARLAVDPAADRWVACLPLAHIGGLSVVTRALVTGTPCTVLRAVRRRRGRAPGRSGRHPGLAGGHRARAGPTPSGYRAVLLGGAAPPTTLPANVVTTYGMTETGSGVVYDGRPLDGVELRIGDGDHRADGRVLVRGPMLLRSYRDGTDPRLPGGWLPTGDGGPVGPDGTLAVFGRMAEVIVTGGEKVWPAPVERVLAGHPGVAEVAVWKRPDPEWGERVVAWVVPADPVRPPGLDELRDLVAAGAGRRGPPPASWWWSDGLPRTPSGKVRRSELTWTRRSHRPRPGRPAVAAQESPPLAMHRAPPSMTRVCPVIHEAASEHRNRAALAMSSASPSRPQRQPARRWTPPPAPTGPGRTRS